MESEDEYVTVYHYYNKAENSRWRWLTIEEAINNRIRYKYLNKQ